MRQLAVALHRRAASSLMVALLCACQAAGPTPSPTPAPTPTPVPTPAPPTTQQVVDRFRALVTGPGVTMHAAETGTVTVTAGGSTQTISIQQDVDISGADGYGSVLIDTGPSTVTVTLLLANGHAYVDNNGTWTEIPGYAPDTPLNPFALLSESSDIQYIGSKLVRGARVHHLATTVWLGASQEALAAQGWSNVAFGRVWADIYVDDNGLPSSLDSAASVTGTLQGTDAAIDLNLTYKFTNVGKPVSLPSPPAPILAFPARTPGQAIYDQVGKVSAAVKASLESKLRTLQIRAGAEVVIYLEVDPSATSTSVAASARELMSEWGVGGSHNHGFVVLVAFQKDKVHGQVGTWAGLGLLAQLPPDAQASLIDKVLLPALKAGDIDGAISKAVTWIETQMP